MRCGSGLGVTLQVIPGTRFMVDGFKWSSSWCEDYFLTHAHSDHTTGLKDTWAHGTIYCSEITARIVQVPCPPSHCELKPEVAKITLLRARSCTLTT